MGEVSEQSFGDVTVDPIDGGLEEVTCNTGPAGPLLLLSQREAIRTPVTSGGYIVPFVFPFQPLATNTAFQNMNHLLPSFDGG